MSVKLRIKKGDKVQVLAGRDKGKQGEVLEVIPSRNRARVAGINTVRRHSKPAMGKPGGIITVEMPIHLSNIACIDPKSGKATRVGYKVLNDGKKVRVAKKSGEVIDN
jgi:large subunit ribosomal protein L24